MSGITPFTFDRRIKAMRFIASAVPLAEPLGRTVRIPRIVKPKGKGCGVESFALEGSFGQADFVFPGSLVKIGTERRFETSGTLEDHLLDGADVAKIQTVRKHPVNPDVCHHQHGEIAVGFGLGTD